MGILSLVFFDDGMVIMIEVKPNRAFRRLGFLAVASLIVIAMMVTTAMVNAAQDDPKPAAKPQEGQTPKKKNAGDRKARQQPAKPAPVIAPRKGESETKTLFDGKTLEGWVGHKHHWSVVDGVIVGKNTDAVKVSTYLLTKDSYSDFRLTANVKLVESEMHSGISFWGRIAPEKNDEFTYAGHLVMFPSGWGMYDLYGRNGLPVDPNPAKKVGKQHDWNKLEILAQGNRVRVAANGAQVIDWRDPEPDRIKTGPIGLQLHSNTVPQEVHFKDIVVETFPKEDRLLTVEPPK